MGGWGQREGGKGDGRREEMKSEERDDMREGWLN